MSLVQNGSTTSLPLSPLKQWERSRNLPNIDC